MILFCCDIHWFVIIFFSSRRRHTRWNCDWSSDVCSSDLSQGQIMKNLSNPSVSSVTAVPISPMVYKTFSLTKKEPSALSADAPFSSITYDAQKNLKTVLNKDGSSLLFENGLLKQALDPQGNHTDFSFTESALSNLVGSEIVQNGLTSAYDAEGKLSRVAVN